MNASIHYDRDTSPPFPYVNLVVSRPEGNNYEPRPGKIDTGASLTTIPIDMVGLLDLQRVGNVPVCAFDGSVDQYNVYRVNIKIGDISREYVRVIATQRNNVLVGRDLINLWHMRLDGPNLTGRMTLS